MARHRRSGCWNHELVTLKGGTPSRAICACPHRRGVPSPCCRCWWESLHKFAHLFDRVKVFFCMCTQGVTEHVLSASTHTSSALLARDFPFTSPLEMTLCAWVHSKGSRGIAIGPDGLEVGPASSCAPENRSHHLSVGADFLSLKVSHHHLKLLTVCTVLVTPVVVAANDISLGKLIVGHLGEEGVPICLGTSATDLGIETEAGKKQMCNLSKETHMERQTQGQES